MSDLVKFFADLFADEIEAPPEPPGGADWKDVELWLRERNRCLKVGVFGDCAWDALSKLSARDQEIVKFFVGNRDEPIPSQRKQIDLPYGGSPARLNQLTHRAFARWACEIEKRGKSIKHELNYAPVSFRTHLEKARKVGSHLCCPQCGRPF